MNTVIDVGAELLVDCSTLRDPYVRLLATAVGHRLATGSPWVAVSKRAATLYCLRPATPPPRGSRARGERRPYAAAAGRIVRPRGGA